MPNSWSHVMLQHFFFCFWTFYQVYLSIWPFSIFLSFRRYMYFSLFYSGMFYFFYFSFFLIQKYKIKKSVKSFFKLEFGKTSSQGGRQGESGHRRAGRGRTAWAIQRKAGQSRTEQGTCVCVQIRSPLGICQACLFWVCIGCGWCCFSFLHLWCGAAFPSLRWVVLFSPFFLLECAAFSPPLVACTAPSLPPWRLLSPPSFGWWCFPFQIQPHEI